MMHVDEKIKVKCVQCGQEFETELRYYFQYWLAEPFCSDSCRNEFFKSRKHPSNCQFLRCKGYDKEGD